MILPNFPVNYTLLLLSAEIEDTTRAQLCVSLSFMLPLSFSLSAHLTLAQLKHPKKKKKLWNRNSKLRVKINP